MCNHHATHRAKQHLPKNVTRRDILRFTLGGVGLAALGPLTMRRLPEAAGAPQNLKRLICINLQGGNDALNMVVPRNLQSQYDTLRPNIKIVSGSQLLLTGGAHGTTAYGLHPAMAQTQALWNLDEVAIVLKTGYPNGNLSHFNSMDYYSYGVRNGFGSLGIPVSGWVARYADNFAQTPTGAVSVGAGRPLDFVGGASHPFMAGTLANFNFQNDNQYGNGAQDSQHRLQVVQNVLNSFAGTGQSAEAKDAVNQGIQLAGQVQAAVAGYSTTVTWPANNGLGNFLKDIATLIQGGFDTRVFYTVKGGFDTHASQGAAAGTQATLLGQLDAAVAAFAQDMKNRGQWNNTRIVIFSEFGRRNYENASTGTDHGEGSVILELGGNLTKPGMSGPDLASTDLSGEYPLYQVDFRDVYKDVLSNHLGAPSTTAVFPEPQPINTVLGIA